MTKATGKQLNKSLGIVEEPWGSFTNYKCPRCPFDSLSAPRVREHIRLMHPLRTKKGGTPAPDADPSTLVIADQHNTTSILQGSALDPNTLDPDDTGVNIVDPEGTGPEEKGEKPEEN